MMLVWLIIVPLAAGVAAWKAGGRNPFLARWICLAGLAVDLAIVLSLWIVFPEQSVLDRNGPWVLTIHRDWIPQLGIGFDLALDGLSLLMVTLTLVLGLASVVCSWTEITERVGFFHFNLMAVLCGIIGVFLATDLILFVIFWEIMLVPMYFLIAVWGHENRNYAAIKFFLFTQAGGLLMLAAIVALYFVHGRETATYTFNYFELLGTPMTPRVSMLIMLGFFAAFAVKLPAVPIHTWLPDAHTEAPTAGSVILAGLLLKTGGYGLIRFVLPLFPDSTVQFAPVAMALGVVGILYGAVMTFAQTDFKRLVAYSSVSHLGFVLLGVFAMNAWALQGAVMQMIAHGISTGALFILAGILQERLHSRELSRMGGLWAAAPIMGGMALLFALASLGLPGMGNFIGEFLVLLGTYQVHPLIAAFAAAGLVLAAVYSLCMVLWAFFGSRTGDWKIPDLSGRELGLTGVLAVAIVCLGFFPQPVISKAEPVFSRVGAASTAVFSNENPGISTSDSPFERGPFYRRFCRGGSGTARNQGASRSAPTEQIPRSAALRTRVTLR